MQLILETIYNFIATAHWIDITAVVTGIIYVILAARNHIACWPFGIISSALAMYSVFFFLDLYIETFLQGFYVLAGFWGWWTWSGHKKKEAKPISTLSGMTHLWILLFGGISTLFFGWLFKQSTAAAATYVDAFTTVFALITTVMVAYRILENWLYWIVIDAVSIYLYWSRGGHFYAILFAVYVVVAIVGYFQWRKELQKRKQLAFYEEVEEMV
jgi:nicotinamide mononucleotide transporter